MGGQVDCNLKGMVYHSILQLRTNQLPAPPPPLGRPPARLVAPGAVAAPRAGDVPARRPGGHLRDVVCVHLCAALHVGDGRERRGDRAAQLGHESRGHRRQRAVGAARATVRQHEAGGGLLRPRVGGGVLSAAAGDPLLLRRAGRGVCADRGLRAAHAHRRIGRASVGGLRARPRPHPHPRPFHVVAQRAEDDRDDDHHPGGRGHDHQPGRLSARLPGHVRGDVGSGAGGRQLLPPDPGGGWRAHCTAAARARKRVLAGPVRRVQRSA